MGLSGLMSAGFFKPQPTDWIKAVPLGLVYAAMAYVSVSLTKGDNHFAAIWLPNALVLALLLRRKMGAPFPLLIATLFGSAVANLASEFPALEAGGLAVANVVEIALGYFLVKRFVSAEPDMDRLADLGGTLLCAAIIAPIASATIAAVIVLPPDTASLGATWLEWAITDAMGILLGLPAALISIDAWRDRRWPTRTEWRDIITIMSVLIIVTVFVFGQARYPFKFLCAPAMVLCAFRLGSLGATAGMAIIAVIAIIGTSLESGPIALVRGDLDDRLLALQIFLAGTFATGLPVAAALLQKRELSGALEQRQEDFALLADNMADAVLRYDPAGNCLYASPSVTEVLGAPPSELQGSNTLIRVHDESREAIADVQQSLSSGAAETRRFTYRRLIDSPAGTPVYIEAFCRVVRDENGQPESIIASLRDVTQRVVLERQLQRARTHAENAAQAKSRFLANMSHEIRTPMNGVLGFTDLLLQGDLSDGQRRHAELIAESGQSMMGLLNDILDISKIEAGQLEVAREEVNLPDILDSCRRLHTASAKAKGLILTCRLGEGLPSIVISDGLRLRQIVHNLLGNAIKFTQHGRVAINADLVEDRIEISVNDTGIGISPERQAAIFKPFEQASATTSRQYGGTGLGLTISRQLAELLGGSLNIHSDEGVGSCFTLQLPAAIADRRSARDARGPEPGPASK